ncbi:DUF7146 domain-containing protein [Pontibaca methylaminivorans]|uniref:Toprim domain-containing protein n=1 Tax=Pontibaca methylaminivorans TaxID=515897 RepID=A0A1R3WAS2_9RHOB|nr:toprim domain-containing protein [Pontibaca methylaminivorans]SIT74896.1 Toprim domain-containing protein [Pontibaca methylaminivorans]
MTIYETDVRAITAALGGRWYGRYGAAPCPVCQPERRKEQNALTVAERNTRLLLHCKKGGCRFEDIAAVLGLRSGGYRDPDAGVVTRRKAEQKAQTARRERQALRLWREALPIEGTPAETYLRGRGITCDLPDTLRFHPECWHGPTARRLPAMVAHVSGAERFAVHRTYLGSDGRNKAMAEPSKMMLGRTLGGAVRLVEGPDGLAVAEGIETALSLACGLLRGRPSIWAALSAGGLVALRLPDRPGKLIIATDGDRAGHEAGYRLATRAHALGWQVSLLRHVASLGPGRAVPWP